MNIKRSEPLTGEIVFPPATTVSHRENQLIAAAMDLAERQIREGKASSQVIVHYLKLGSSREKLEQHKIQLEGELLTTKRELMDTQKGIEKLYTDALQAMRSYQGVEPQENSPEDEEYDD